KGHAKRDEIASEDTLLPFGREFEDRVVGIVHRILGHKEIARFIKDQAPGTNAGSECGLFSVWGKFKDQIVILVRNKKIARSVKGHVIYDFRHKPICERALRSIGRIFEDRAVVVRYEQVTLAVKRLVAGLSVDGHDYCCQTCNCQCDE